jgi:hypothetical protein
LTALKYTSHSPEPCPTRPAYRLFGSFLVFLLATSEKSEHLFLCTLL